MMMIFLLLGAAGLASAQQQVTLVPTADTVCHGAGVEFQLSQTGAASYSYALLACDDTAAQQPVYDTLVRTVEATVALDSLTATRHYRLQVVDSADLGNDSLLSGWVTVTVWAPLRAGTIAAGLDTVCHNSSTVVRFDTASSGAEGTGFDVKWQQSTNNTFYTNLGYYDSLVTAALVTPRYYRAIVFSALCGTNDTTNVVLVGVYDTLHFGSMTESETLCYGDSVALGVDSVGGGSGRLSYLWQQGSGIMVPMGTAPTFQSPALTASTEYHLTVSDELCGLSRQYSTSITVYDTLTVPTIAADTTVVCHGATATLRVSVPATGGDTVQYEWQQLVDSVWTALDGATDTVFVAGPLTDTATFRVRAFSGCGEQFSAAVQVDVMAGLQFAGHLIAEMDTVCYFSPFVLRMDTAAWAVGVAEGDSCLFEWYYVNDGSDQVLFMNQTGDSVETRLTNFSRSYYVQVSSLLCPTAVDTTNHVHVTVRPQFAAGVFDAVAPVCFDSVPGELALTTPFEGGTGSYTYLWEKRAADAEAWDTVYVNVDSVYYVDDTVAVDTTMVRLWTAASYQPTAVRGDTLYRLSAYDAGCDARQSATVSVLAMDELQGPVVAAPSEAVICYSTQPDTLRMTQGANGGDSLFAYQWYRQVDTAGWQPIAGADSTVYQPDTLTVSTRYRLAATGSCGTVYSNEVLVSVVQPVQAGTLTGDTTVCYHGMATLSLDSLSYRVDDNYSRRWLVSSDGESYDELRYGDNRPVVDTPLFVSDALEEARYFRVEVSSALCGGIDTTNAVLVNVWEPFASRDIRAASGSADRGPIACYGQPSDCVVLAEGPASGGSGDYSYLWIASTDGMAYVEASGTNTDCNSYAPGLLYETTHYRRVSMDVCGVDTSNVATITVAPLPAMPSLFGDTAYLCNSYNQVRYWVAPDAGMSYLWNTLDGNTADIDSSVVFVQWHAGKTSVELSLTMTNVATGCQNDTTYHIAIDTMHQAPAAAQIKVKRGARLLICSDDTPDAHYEWGYTERATGIDTVIPNSDSRYIQLPHDIDTNRFDYYVTVWYGTVPCRTRSYYEAGTQGSKVFNAAATLTVSPNPSRGDISYSLDTDIEGSYELTIHDAVGQPVYSAEGSDYDMGSRIHVDHQLRRGVYIVSVTSNNQVVSQKIIVK